MLHTHQIISCDTDVVNGRVQHLHTQHVKLISIESHGVFYFDTDQKSDCSRQQVEINTIDWVGGTRGR